MGLPQLAVLYTLDTFPYRCIPALLVPARSEMPVIETEHLGRQPARHMHAIRDVPDGNRIFRTARIQAGPHGARHLAVQSGNRVGAARELEPKDRHAEFFVWIARILPAQCHEMIVRESE